MGVVARSPRTMRDVFRHLVWALLGRRWQFTGVLHVLYERFKQLVGVVLVRLIGQVTDLCFGS